MAAQAPQFNAENWVTGKIKEAATVMISKSYCPYCTQAYNVLKKYDGNVKKIEIDQMPADQTAAIQAYCKTLTGASSVPRV